MVELQLDGGSAVSATSVVPHPHELLDVVGYCVAGADPTGVRTHGNHGLSPLDALSRPLLARDEQSVDLLRRESVAVPVEPPTEVPVVPLVYGRDVHRELGLPVLRGREVRFAHSDDPVAAAADVEDDPALGGKESRAVGQAHVIGAT